MLFRSLMVISAVLCGALFLVSESAARKLPMLGPLKNGHIESLWDNGCIAITVRIFTPLCKPTKAYLSIKCRTFVYDGTLYFFMSLVIIIICVQNRGDYSRVQFVEKVRFETRKLFTEVNETAAISGWH